MCECPRKVQTVLRADRDEAPSVFRLPAVPRCLIVGRCGGVACWDIPFDRALLVPFFSEVSVLQDFYALQELI